MKYILLAVAFIISSCGNDYNPCPRQIYGDLKNITNVSLAICIEDYCDSVLPAENFSLNSVFDTIFFEASFYNPKIWLKFYTDPPNCLLHLPTAEAESKYFSWFDWKEDSTVYFRNYHESHTYYSATIGPEILSQATPEACVGE